MTQDEISNITTRGSKRSAEGKFKTWSQRRLNLLATVMRSGALVAQAETSNITASGIEHSTEVRFKSYPLGVVESLSPGVILSTARDHSNEVRRTWVTG